MDSPIHVYIDGACRGNPGPAGIGVVVKENGAVIKEISQPIGDATNNIAEYTALIYALQEALIQRADDVLVHTDSELLFNQISGRYKIKNPALQVLHRQIEHLRGGIKTFRIRHIPREQNKDADKLAISAIKKGQTVMAAPLFDFGEESPSSKG